MFRNHLPPQKDETYKNIEQVFGLANFERFYDRVEPQWRDALIDSYAYEANERIKDPIHGITKDITLLQQRLANTKRLGTANVLVSGLAACTVKCTASRTAATYPYCRRITVTVNTCAKFCKHIVVAGVKSLTLNDDRMITQDLLYGNSLIKPNEEFHRDKTIAQVCSESLSKFNSKASIHVLQGDILNFSAADFEKFDTVIISCCSEIKRREVNSRCRQLTDPIAFYSVQCRGSLAEIFVDLKSHTRLFGQDLKSIMEFCSFEEAIAVPWKILPKGLSEIFLAMRVAENFEATHRTNVGKLSATDFQNLKTFKDVLCDKQQFNHNHISSATLEKLIGITACNIHSIVGAILAQRFLYLIYIPFNCRDDVVVAVAETPAPALEEPMDIMTALQLVLRKSRPNGGLNEGAKVIENHAAQLCVLSKGLGPARLCQIGQSTLC
ncbi:40S ribosomal protein S12 [Capsicum baccatum]|uniref:40S ribosomal protein S12 n=1 Tax=Capsicum baccatum TaxID=33114 RepID=A0A2G2X760_CAPBA|nr:40S ribosomal protein S12 [Capsicum baccatum]